MRHTAAGNVHEGHKSTAPSEECKIVHSTSPFWTVLQHTTELLVGKLLWNEKCCVKLWKWRASAVRFPGVQAAYAACTVPSWWVQCLHSIVAMFLPSRTTELLPQSLLHGTSTRLGLHAVDGLLGPGVFRQPDKSAGTLSVSDNGGKQHIVVQGAASEGPLRRMPPRLLHCNVSGGNLVITGCG